MTQKQQGDNNKNQILKIATSTSDTRKVVEGEEQPQQSTPKPAYRGTRPLSKSIGL